MTPKRSLPEEIWQFSLARLSGSGELLLKAFNGCAETFNEVFLYLVKQLHQIVGLVLLLLWVPVTTHCTLETVPGLEFLKCGADAPEKDKQCDGDGCSQLETATYKTSDSHNDFQPLAFINLLPFVLMDFPEDQRPAAVLATPPEISSNWQFSLRTAPSPRAPSFVS